MYNILELFQKEDLPIPLNPTLMVYDDTWILHHSFDSERGHSVDHTATTPYSTSCYSTHPGLISDCLRTAL